METFRTVARHLGRPLVIVDAGCRWGPASSWTALAPFVRLFGFDPDPAECALLDQQFSSMPGATFVPLALGKQSSTALLHVTEEPACSSLYPPDPVLIAERPSLSITKQVGSQEVDLVALDEWAAAEGVREVDFIKLDVQGSELSVLQGAERMLTSVAAVEVEVEFNPIYSGQPLFGDVDAFLRQHGFVLWRFGDLVHYGLPEGISRYDSPQGHVYDDVPVRFTGFGGQVYWTDAFYVAQRFVQAGESSDWVSFAAAACITGTLGFRDLAVMNLRSCFHFAPPEARTAAEALMAQEKSFS